MNDLEKAKRKEALRRRTDPRYNYFISEIEKQFVTEWRLVKGRWQLLVLGVALKKDVIQ
jgi:hypothetical protein